MTSQPGYQTIKNQILPNISRTKNNKTMKFDQLTREIFFLKNHAENNAGRLIPDLFFSFLKNLISGKSKWSPA